MKNLAMIFAGRCSKDLLMGIEVEKKQSHSKRTPAAPRAQAGLIFFSPSPVVAVILLDSIMDKVSVCKGSKSWKV